MIVSSGHLAGLYGFGRDIIFLVQDGSWYGIKSNKNGSLQQQWQQLLQQRHKLDQYPHISYFYFLFFSDFYPILFALMKKMAINYDIVWYCRMLNMAVAVDNRPIIFCEVSSRNGLMIDAIVIFAVLQHPYYCFDSQGYIWCCETNSCADHNKCIMQDPKPLEPISVHTNG